MKHQALVTVVLPGILLVPVLPVTAAGKLMEEMVVNATRTEVSLGDTPAAISVIEQDDIQTARQQLTLDESLARVPGVFLQNAHNFSQAQRISIRGFGARSPFGIRGIRLIIDGVPATMPDGQGNVDEIDLGSASRIEIIRGPSSSLYGTASGGVISIQTEDGPERPYVEGRVSVGEDGYQQYQLKAGGQFESLNYTVSGSRLDYDGYRDNAWIEKTVFNSRLRYAFDEDASLTASLNLLDIPDMGDPGALRVDEVETDRRMASPNNLRYAAGESRSQQRLGLVYRNRFGEHHEITLRNYYTFMDFANSLPFTGGIEESNGGQVTFDREFIGGGAQYTYHQTVLDYTFRFIAGVDIDRQEDDRQRYENLEGTRGALTMDQTEKVSSLGAYVQTEFALLEDLQLTLGTRFDEVNFDIIDRFTDNLSGDDSGESSFNRISPRVGLSWGPAENLNLYFNFSTAFETPTTTEFANPDGGGFNPDLKTQTARNVEAGLKAGLATAIPVDMEFALFHVRVNNELVPFEEDGLTGRTFFRNAGISTREGFEAGLTAWLLPALRASLAYSYIDATFNRFRTATENFDGNRIPGVPSEHLHAELRYDDPRGWYSALDMLYVDDFLADNANLVRTESYAVSNFRLGYRKELDNWIISPHLTVNNLTNEKYNSNVRLNATFGRYYEPAPLRNISGGVSARLTF